MGSGSPTRSSGRPRADDYARLEQRVAELERLLDNADGIVWEGVPQDFRFVYVSQRAERLLGYPVAQWVSEPQFWLNHLHPEDRKWAPSACYSATAAGQDHELEFRMIAADGRVVWLRDFVCVVQGDAGEPLMSGLMVDITARKESEQRMERRNTALHDLASSEALESGDFDLFARLAMQTASHVLDVERMGVWLFNDDRSTLRCESLYQRSLDRHSSGAELEAVAYPRYFAALAEGRFVSADDAMTDSKTSEFAEGYLAPLGITSMLDAPLQRGEQLIGVVCHEHVGPARRWLHDERDFATSVAHFVTHSLEAQKRRRAEQDVRLAQQRLLDQELREKERVERELTGARERLVRQARLGTIGQIAASMAHELRNPLGAIRNATFFLSRHGPQSDARWSKYLAIIEQEVDSADGIIGDLLEVSRAKVPVKTRIDLAATVQAAFDRLRPSAVRFELSVEPDPFELVADEGQLKQVFTNLMVNAVDATEGQGTIRVELRRLGAVSRITVQDDGPGIEPDDRHRVFEPLFTTRAKGTGLGLPVCRQIIEAHGGTIGIAEQTGAGARFEIRLPGEEKDR